MDAIAQLNTALLGRYAIEREIGAGGMATVYLARDTRHDRRVALKVLNPELGAVLGVERFLAEIKVTANLQHPNLLPLFDSGEAEGLLFYVMPYVEGESLRARLTREKQLPIDEAVRIATAVASALDYAHRHGVVHRDLKPENILLHEGQPLVADFGIALAVSKAGGGRLTQTGLSLGTPHYMSPEQATGDRVIDARSDIYSLGALTYELLTGDPPHVGSSSQAVIALVMTEAPRSVRVTRPLVPAHVDATVLRALEKVPADRFATAHEFADALSGKVIVTTAVSGLGAAPGVRPVTRREAWRLPLTRTLAAALAITLTGWAGREWIATQRDGERRPIRFTVAFDDSVSWAPAAGVALSPDGRRLVFVASRERGPRLLHVRSLDDLRPRALAGTEGASQPFFSPDGRWVGFWADAKLKKLPVDGGTVVFLADVPSLQGAHWATADQIIVSSEGRLAGVPATGGALDVFSSRDTAAAQTFQRWPVVLSDGKTVLYARAQFTGIAPSPQRLGVASDDGTLRQALELTGSPLAEFDGHLIYASGAAIMAVSFDARTLRPSGTPVPLMDNVSGLLRPVVSRDGSIAYATGGTSPGNRLMIGTAHSAPRPLSPDVRRHSFPRYSPDGKHLALTIGEGNRADVWILDLPSGPMRRLTTEGTNNDRPEWTPDGRNVLFRSNRDGRNAFFVQPADGHRAAELFFKLPDLGVDEVVLSSKGDYFVFQHDKSLTEGAGRVFYRAVRGDTTIRPIETIDRGFHVTPRLSPDGRWVAYTSTESGLSEVYVRPFPSLDARYQVSLQRGQQPVWSRDGRRLFYRWGGRLMSASLSLSPFSVVARDTLAENMEGDGANHATYDVGPDGSFVFKTALPATPAQLVLVHDWKYELRARMNSARR